MNRLDAGAMDADTPELLGFDEAELISILRDLVAENSENPPGREAPLAYLIQARLDEAGIPSELSWAAPERPNVVARLRGTSPGPRVIYNGHLDVVPVGTGWTASHDGQVSGSRLYGRGAADMKAGVAAMLYAAIVLQRLGRAFAGELILYFNVDEEHTNLGMKRFLADDIRADFTIISEPTGLDVCLGHRGCGRFRLSTFGTAGHTAFVETADNAIYKMAKLVLALEEFGQELAERRDPLLGAARLTVSEIRGGSAPNIVPDTCRIEIDRRVLPGETRGDVSSELESLLSRVADAQGFSYDLDNYLFLPASKIDAAHPFVERTHSRAGRWHPESSLRMFEATCEAPFFSVNCGIPTVIFGPGHLAQAHVADEYVELDEVAKASKVFIDLLMTG